MINIAQKIKIFIITKKSYKRSRKRHIKKIKNIKDYKDFKFSQSELNSILLNI